MDAPVKKTLEIYFLRLYMTITAPRVVVTMLALVTGWWMAPFLSSLLLVPRMVVILASFGVGYLLGTVIERKTRAPWSHVLCSPPLAPRGPLISIERMPRSNFIMQRFLSRQRQSDDHAHGNNTSRNNILTYHRLVSMPQDLHVNFRHLQQQPHGTTLREGKEIGSWMLMTTPRSSSLLEPNNDLDPLMEMENAVMEAERAMYQAVPYLRCQEPASPEVALKTILINSQASGE